MRVQPMAEAPAECGFGKNVPKFSKKTAKMQIFAVFLMGYERGA